MDDAGAPDDVQRRVAANQPHVAALIVDTIRSADVDSDVELAAVILGRIQAHYELRPR